ncbi:MAG: cytosolic protein [Magnetococcales bacterium]|nr:cytosolic protein [Magnetococcales bacterium]
MVRSYLIMSGSGAMLVLTKMSQGMQSDVARDTMLKKGIRKYIAFEVPPARAKERYGARFEAVSSTITQENDIRVMDVDGHHVFANFEFREMGEPAFVGEGDRISK